MTKAELEKEAEEYADWFWGASPSMMKALANAYIKGAEPREKRIAELEKRCANYEMNISKMEKGTCDICKETEKDKKIEELEAQIEKMKQCSMCKYSSKVGYCKLRINGGECNNKDKWELADD